MCVTLCMIGRLFACFRVSEGETDEASTSSRERGTMGGGTSKQAAAIGSNQSYSRLDGSRSVYCYPKLLILLLLFDGS